jgi:quercetin dioxygenase-like cupin family protein
MDMHPLPPEVRIPNKSETVNEPYFKNFSEADEIKHMGHKEGNWMKILKLPSGYKVGYALLQPGFSLNLCNSMHFGYLIQGKIRVTMSNGTSQSKLFEAGDVFFIPPDHTTLVEGDEPARALHLLNFYEMSDFGTLGLFQKNVLKDADEVRKLPNAQINVVKLNENITFSVGTFKPGWRWSKDIKPIVATDLCMHAHMGFGISGQMKLLFNGEEKLFQPEDLFFIPPGHDGEVMGDTDAVCLDFGSYRHYGLEPSKIPK